MTTLYGLNNCDTCKKARKWLDRFGVAHAFVDYRDQRQAPETLVEWKDKLGGWDAMINKSSTTWRTLARQPQDAGLGRRVEAAAEGIPAADPPSGGGHRRRRGVSRASATTASRSGSESAQ